MDFAYDPIADARALALVAARLDDPRIEAHFTKNKHKQAATREVLDLLGIPLPDWARRCLSGRAAASKAAMDRFREDYPDHAARTPYYKPPAR